MSRGIHYLKKNADNRIPQHLLVVDTETNILKKDDYNQEQRFRLGCAIYLRRDTRINEWLEHKLCFYDLGDFYRFVDGICLAKRKLVIFAHNAAFDYTILKMDSYLSDRGFVVDMRTTDSVFIINAHRNTDDGRISLSFADTMNYYKMSLKKLGRIFGSEKMSTPDFENVSDKKLMEYCEQDTYVLASLMKQHIGFITEHDLGNFKLTIASQAFNAYRHRFMKEKILVHNFEDIINMELSSYRGGRCEVFKMGVHEHIYKLDINSMYPFVMRNNLFPNILLSKKIMSLTHDNVEDYFDKGLFVLADCKFELKYPAIAVKKEKLMFPIGKIRQVLTSPEIQYIMENPEIGRIISFDRCVVYEQQNLFKEYVDYFYGIRKSTVNAAHEAIAKLLLNSLYGKFGQRAMSSLSVVEDAGETERIVAAMDSVGTNTLCRLGKKICKYIRLGSVLYEITISKDSLAYDSSPVIASTVTAYSRDYLFQLMFKARLENVLYCDTDSVFVNEEGFENLKSEMSQTELGMLKLEEIGDCEIFGAKNYRFNNEVKLKGVKKDALKIGENCYKQTQFLTKNLRYNKGIEDGLIVVRPLIKTISNKYDKGIVKNGQVYPLVYSDF